MCGVSKHCGRMASLFERATTAPQLYEAPLIRNRKTFKCYVAFRSIPASCHMPSCLLSIYFECVVPDNLTEWTSHFFIFNVHWSDVKDKHCHLKIWQPYHITICNFVAIQTFDLKIWYVQKSLITFAQGCLTFAKARVNKMGTRVCVARCLVGITLCVPKMGNMMISRVHTKKQHWYSSAESTKRSAYGKWHPWESSSHLAGFVCCIWYYRPCYASAMNA